jgi:hypothetical protein
MIKARNWEMGRVLYEFGKFTQRIISMCSIVGALIRFINV